VVGVGAVVVVDGAVVVAAGPGGVVFGEMPSALLATMGLLEKMGMGAMTATED